MARKLWVTGALVAIFAMAAFFAPHEANAAVHSALSGGVF